MVDIPSIHNVISTSQREGLLSMTADVSIVWAIVDDPDPQAVGELRDAFVGAWKEMSGETQKAEDFWESVSRREPKDRRWHDLLLEVSEPVDQHRQAVILADLCVDSAYADDSELVSGPGARRLNAVLDLLEMPFAASDVQDFYAAMGSGLAEMKTNYVHDAATYGAAFAGGFAGGWFGMPFIRSGTLKGVSFFADEITKTDDCSLGTAALLTCALAATEFPGGDADVELVRTEIRRLAEAANHSFARHRAQSMNVYTGDAAQADRHRRILNAALGIVNEIAGSEPSRQAVPNLFGMTLSAARDLLNNMGITVTEEDALNQNRWVMNATNWRVVGQEPAAGQIADSIRLYVKKYDE